MLITVRFKSMNGMWPCSHCRSYFSYSDPTRNSCSLILLHDRKRQTLHEIAVSRVIQEKVKHEKSYSRQNSSPWKMLEVNIKITYKKVEQFEFKLCYVRAYIFSRVVNRAVGLPPLIWTISIHSQQRLGRHPCWMLMRFVNCK